MVREPLRSWMLVLSTCAATSVGCAPAPSDGAPAPVNVVRREQLGADWACASPDDCTADYLRFLDLAADHARPLDAATLDARVVAIGAGDVPLAVEPLAADALADAIVEATGIGFLLEDLDARELQVVTVGRGGTDSYDEAELLLTDPLLGTFKGILLMPKGEGPFPAVVAVHGHPESAEVFRDLHHGAEFPSRGYAILMLTMRVMAIDDVEREMSWRLLEQGFSLVGLRVVEALLGLKVLRTEPRVDADRIGLIGHSGGASASNLTVRLEPRLRAYVSDNQVDWFRSGEDEPYHCETVPGLYPLHARINDFSTSATPIDPVLYGFLGAFPGVFDFFDRNL